MHRSPRARPPSLAVICQPFYHYIIGLAVGQTNVYFFGAAGRRVEGRNIAVLLTS
jgi:Flp pilus assembly secretin CpaC